MLLQHPQTSHHGAENHHGDGCFWVSVRVSSADAGLGAASTEVMAGLQPDRCIGIEVQGSKK